MVPLDEETNHDSGLYVSNDSLMNYRTVPANVASGIPA